jgi:hypothetical protein
MNASPLMRIKNSMINIPKARNNCFKKSRENIKSLKSLKLVDFSGMVGLA